MDVAYFSTLYEKKTKKKRAKTENITLGVGCQFVIQEIEVVNF